MDREAGSQQEEYGPCERGPKRAEDTLVWHG
jgi:hypothetical protein